MKNSWKRVIAGTLAVLVLAGTVPADLGINGLFGGNSTSITAYADNTGTLLTTITATGKEQAGYSTASVATVSFSNLPNYSSSYNDNWGWWGYGWTATVTPAEGYTITKCVFYDDEDRKATDSEAPFVVETEKEDKTPKVNGVPILAYTSKGIKKIEVYGYATPEVTTRPTAASGLTCNGGAQKLLAENGTGEASAGSTMQYAVVPDGKKPATKIVTGNGKNEVPQVGAVYKPTGLYGISFPNHHIMYNGNEYYISEGVGNVYLYTATGKTIISGLSTAGSTAPVNLPDNCDAIRVTSISDTAITVEAVNSADYVQAAYGDATTATATNVGKYDVYYKAVRNDGAESAADHIDVTIAKGNPVITAPQATNPGYNGQPQNLITAGNVATGTKIKYGVSDTLLDLTNPNFAEGIEVQTDNISLTVDNPQAGYIYKPVDTDGIDFKNYNLNINGTNYQMRNSTTFGNYVSLYSADGTLKVFASSGIAAIGNYDAILVKRVEGDTIYAEPVVSSNYTVFKMTESVPQKTNIGTYYV